MLKNRIPLTPADEPAHDWSELFIELELMLKHFHDAKLSGEEKRAAYILVEADAVMLELRRANAK